MSFYSPEIEVLVDSQKYPGRKRSLHSNIGYGVVSDFMTLNNFLGIAFDAADVVCFKPGNAYKNIRINILDFLADAFPQKPV